MTPARCARTAILALAAAAVLAGCGRKADLDPPGVTRQPAQATAETAPPVPERRFILDGLLE